MEKSFGQNDSKIADYAEQVFAPLDEILNEIRTRSLENRLPQIQVCPMDGLHLEVLTRGFGVTKAVEIGTLGGYSGVCIARGLKPGGKLFTFEVNAENALVAAESFRRAGVDNQVEIIVGAASEKLPGIEAHGPFDMVFIDADKTGYPKYLTWAARHLRLGGALIADNTFAWGTIAHQNFDSDQTAKSVAALREFNQECATGGRFRSTILPTGEGLTIAVKIK